MLINISYNAAVGARVQIWLRWFFADEQSPLLSLPVFDMIA